MQNAPKYNNSVKEYVKNTVQSLSSDDREFVYSEVKSRVLEQFNLVMTTQDIYEMVYRSRKIDKAIEDINEAIGDVDYEHDDSDYIFYVNEIVRWEKVTQKMRIPIQIVDDIFSDYTVHGKNMTGEQIMQKYQLKPKAWNVLKKYLSLTKHSHVVSPISMERMWEEELDAKIDEVTYQHIDKYRNKYQEKHQRLMKKESVDALSKVASMQYTSDLIKETLSSYKWPNIKYKLPEIKNADEYTLVISDIHVGKSGTQDVIDRLAYIAQQAISRQESTVNIVFLGDIMEAFVEMHPWQSQDMETKLGIESYQLAVDTLEEFAISIARHKRISFRWIPWNHDRWAVKNEDDQKRMIGLIALSAVEKTLRNLEIDVQLFVKEMLRNEVTYHFDLSNIRYIINHWDGNFDNKIASDILWKHGDQTKHNVILSWDKHNARVTEWENFTRIRVPAIAWKWSYDTRLWLWSEPWYATVEMNSFWTADISIKRLKK